MSEGCNGCKYVKLDVGGGGAAGSSNFSNDCSSDASGCACRGGLQHQSKTRVQVRAKVLYGSGTAIANLRAKEKATNRPNL